MSNSNWRNRPTSIEEWKHNATYTLFMDESGNPTMKNLGVNNQYFTLCGALFDKGSLNNAMNEIVELKNKYWENGCYNYKDGCKKVLFHTYDIERKNDAFSSRNIDYNSFCNDLSNFIVQLNTTLIACTIDKIALNNRYKNPYSPYDVSLKFILERLVNHILGVNDTAVLVLESRGRVEDKNLLNQIKAILDNGTEYVDISLFQKIKGVYFNNKWSRIEEYQKSYYGLEIADLCSYPIWKYCQGQKDRKDYKAIESKICEYPNYIGKGLKIFP